MNFDEYQKICGLQIETAFGNFNEKSNFYRFIKLFLKKGEQKHRDQLRRWDEDKVIAKFICYVPMPWLRLARL